MKKQPILEVCVDSYDSCLAAKAGGADRIELCANLVIGGTTPSYAFFDRIKTIFPCVNVLIRPRFGDFLYSFAEVDQMCREISYFAENGANGVVIGALDKSGNLDKGALSAMKEAAGNLRVTLSRAFDMTCDPFASLEVAASLNIDTVLTSGQKDSAMSGAQLLKELNAAADGRADIMAGGGINSRNIARIFAETGITSFHASAKKTVESGMIYRKECVHMGLPSLSEYELFVSDESEVRACANMVHSLINKQ